ncbi:MAG: hypothetical protein QF666_16045 [Alphaproteobacteria bacterium]|nr:hypothetical protein [Alphaproteobacteria bacterium]
MRIELIAILLVSLALIDVALLHAPTASAATLRGIGVTLKESEAMGRAARSGVRGLAEAVSVGWRARWRAGAIRGESRSTAIRRFLSQETARKHQREWVQWA